MNQIYIGLTVSIFYVLFFCLHTHLSNIQNMFMIHKSLFYSLNLNTLNHNIIGSGQVLPYLSSALFFEIKLFDNLLILKQKKVEPHVTYLRGLHSSYWSNH